jgi:hypothetical protein
VTCTVCGTALPAGDYAACWEERRCLEHCTDFAGHTGPSYGPSFFDPDEIERVNSLDDDEDRAYDTAVDMAIEDAHAAGEPENWRAYLRGGR